MRLSNTKHIINPLKLFAAGEVGCVIDFTDRTTLFTDVIATAPIVSLGDTILYVKDKTANTIDFSQAVNGPLWSSLNGIVGAKFDATNDVLQYTVGGGLAIFQNVGFATVIISAVASTALGATQFIFFSSTNTAGGASTRVGTNISATNFLTTGTRRVDGEALTSNSWVDRTSFALDPGFIVTSEVDFSNNQSIMSVGMGGFTNTVASAGGAGLTSNTASLALCIGASGLTASNFYGGLVNRIIAIPRRLTASELRGAQNWCAAGMGKIF